MNIITKLSIRQKVMLTLTVLAAAFLTWQIYNFVHGNSMGVQPINPTTPHPISIKSPTNTLPPPPVKPLPARETSHVTLTASQQAYLGLVREYQVTKIRRQILEEQAGLANAQKRITDASRNGMLANYGTYGDVLGSDSVDNAYELTYLDRQAGQWTATLNRNGKYQEVHVGTRLSDGASVVSINNKGVVLRTSRGKSRMVSFQGSINVDYTNEDDKASPTTTQTPANKSPEKAAAEKNPHNLNNITNTINSNNAKIAKILGITTAPPSNNGTPAAPTGPAETLQNITKQLQGLQSPAAQVDIPAAPLTQPTPTTPPPPASAPVAPQSNNPAPAASSTPLKPVSVKELQKSLGINEASAQGLSQISWDEQTSVENPQSPSNSR